MSDDNDIIENLINSNADEWNNTVANQLGISVNILKEIITAKELQIAENKIDAAITKQQIKELADEQINIDKDISDMNKGEFDSVYQANVLDKYTISISENNEDIIESIALTGKIIIGFDFSVSDLSNSYFCGCLFYNCNFNNTSLENSVITGCVFNTCDLGGCDFTGSTLTRNQIFESSLINTTLEYCTITDSMILTNSMTDVTFTQSKILHTGFSDCIIHNSDWKDTDIVQCSFTSCHFTGSDFKRSTIVDCIFIRSDFTKCDFNSTLVSCITQTMCVYEEKYSYLFEMDHLLYSPAIFEWEPSKEIDEDEGEGDDTNAW